MSQFIGASGSLVTQTYEQPAAVKGTPQLTAMGNFLGPGAASLGADDPSRQRPQSYVLPTQIELMGGFFNVLGANVASTYGEPGSVSVMSLQPPANTTGPTFTATGAVARGEQGSAGPYGLTYGARINPKTCRMYAGCHVNNSGGCQCKNGETYY
jgi:hypothetical protein